MIYAVAFCENLKQWIEGKTCVYLRVSCNRPSLSVKGKSKKFNLMLTGKNNSRFMLPKLSKDLLKNKFFTSESLAKLGQSYRKKTRKSAFFCYLCVNIRLNFSLLPGSTAQSSVLCNCFYGNGFFARLCKSLKTTSANSGLPQAAVK